ncbi:2Fe-2S iron-sulfur cluster-binding protein [Vibrio sp. 10N.286.49.F3]|uniref:2Fe-2S iron-sulfur cluster-binding protein n=1 Tax=unclassified Vibrio TaxID=2614977 RepID=UPI00354D9C17
MHTISLNSKQFPAAEDDTVLQAAEKAGEVIYSECRDGFCGACKCKLKSGAVVPTRKTIAYLPEGYILTCSVKANSDLVLELDS